MTRNDNVTVVALNKIKRKTNADRFILDDFLAVSPYNIEQLRSRNNKAEIVMWRHIACAWLMLAGHSLSSAGRFLERSHCTMKNSLEAVLSSLDGFGNPDIRTAVLSLCEQSRKELLVSVPFADYMALLQKHFGTSDQVERMARDSYGFIPSVIV